MVKEEIRKTLKGMGVESIGVYTVNGNTTIALHLKSGTDEIYVKEFLSFYLDEGQVLL